VARYAPPDELLRSDGGQRRVGFELEFSGIDLAQALAAMRRALGGRVVESSAAECRLQVDGLGEFNVEIDWAFLKRKAAQSERGEADPALVEVLSQAASLLVPMEVVCPPIEIGRLAGLDPMVAALREAGAVGTEESPLAAYGVHINTEIAAPEAPRLLAYLRAFGLLQWWLVDAQRVDITRRISPYIDLYPQDYVELLCIAPLADADVLQLIDDYLAHNPTRNRALDMLPMFARIDAARVARAIDDPRVKARPTFHYRLPDCHIEHSDWSLDDAWRSWLVVERLAHERRWLDELGAQYLAQRRPLLGVARRPWTSFLDRWLKDRALA